MHRIRAILVCLSAASVVASCKSKEENPSPAVSETPVPPVTPASKCTVDHAASGACSHVLPLTWNTYTNTQLVDWITHSDRDWKVSAYKGIKRKYKSANCNKGQPKQMIRAPGDSRRMNADPGVAWEPGASVVMAEIVPDGGGKCADDVYNVSSEDTARHFFVIYTVAQSFSQNASGDTIIGTWSIVSLNLTKPEEFRGIASSGVYVRCAHSHKPAHVSAVGRFDSCNYKRKYLAFADSNSLSAEQVFMKVDSLRENALAAKSAAMASAPDSVTIKLANLVRMQDGPNEPAWTTCSLGCCTAEEPTIPASKPTSLAKPAAKFRRASAATRLALARSPSSN